MYNKAVFLCTLFKSLISLSVFSLSTCPIKNTAHAFLTKKILNVTRQIEGSSLEAKSCSTAR